MTICPNCSHQNPPGATQCEACFTPLPATTSCPNCGATVQLDATFCGQCGTSIKAAAAAAPLPSPPVVEAAESALPPTIIAGAAPAPGPTAPSVAPPAVEPVAYSAPEITPVIVPPVVVPPAVSSEPVVEPIQNFTAPVSTEPVTEPSTPALLSVAPTAPPATSTQLQQPRFQLTHVQSGTVLEIPMHLNVVHIGKPNDQVPPDIDVSGFPCSEVVSRVHADIRIDGDAVYLEDINSANGTYVNHNALPKGNRHLLRVGDRISLGKGDLVTFLFQEM